MEDFHERWVWAWCPSCPRSPGVLAALTKRRRRKRNRTRAALTPEQLIKEAEAQGRPETWDAAVPRSKAGSAAAVTPSSAWIAPREAIRARPRDRRLRYAAEKLRGRRKAKRSAGARPRGRARTRGRRLRRAAWRRMRAASGPRSLWPAPSTRAKGRGRRAREESGRGERRRLRARTGYAEGGRGDLAAAEAAYRAALATRREPWPTLASPGCCARLTAPPSEPLPPERDRHRSRAVSYRIAA